MEYPSYTACSHIFCQSCLADWLDPNKEVEGGAAQRCPTCNTQLRPDQVTSLKVGISGMDTWAVGQLGSWDLECYSMDTRLLIAGASVSA